MLLEEALTHITNSIDFKQAVSNYPQQGAFCRNILIRLQVDPGNNNSIYCDANFDYGQPGNSKNDIRATVIYRNGDFKDVQVS